MVIEAKQKGKFSDQTKLTLQNVLAYMLRGW